MQHITSAMMRKIRYKKEAKTKMSSLLVPFLLFVGAIISVADAFATPRSFSGSRGSVRNPSFEAVHPPFGSLSTTAQLNAGAKGGIELAGLLYDSTSTAFDAWEW
jgi:hypothetical protein